MTEYCREATPALCEILLKFMRERLQREAAIAAEMKIACARSAAAAYADACLRFMFPPETN